MRSLSAWGCALSGLAFAACAGRAEPAVPAAAEPPARAWIGGWAQPGRAGLLFEGLEPEVGTRLTIVDEAGVAGGGEVSAEAPLDCDDCIRQRFLVQLDEGSRTPLEPAVAVSPEVAEGARVLWQPFPALDGLTAAPATYAAVDRDGDGRADLEIVVRCGELVASGCDRQVCGEVCRAVRRAGDDVLRDELCQRFIPDVEDCLPDDE